MSGSGEYIEREAAKNILLQHQHRFTCADEANGYGSVKWSEDVIYLSEAVNGMDAIPAADVRPVVKATWKRIDFKPCGHDYECSSCGWKNDMVTHFCPSCGARMEES